MAMPKLTAALFVCLTGLSTIDAAQAQFTMDGWHNAQNELHNLRQQMDRDREAARQQMNQERDARRMEESLRGAESARRYNNPCNSNSTIAPPC